MENQRIFVHIVSAVLVLCLIFALSLPAFGREYSKSDRKPLTPQQLKAQLVGPILSIATPFTSSLEIDHEAVTKRIKKAIKYQCKVITLTAGDSKYDRITFEEAKSLTRTVALAVGDDAIFMGAAGYWTGEQIIDYASYCESLGAAGILVLFDIEKMKEDEIVEYYQQIADSTSLGICGYGNFSESLLDRLIEIESFVSMKEDISLPYLVDRVIKYGDRLAIFPGGTDDRYLVAYPYGAPAYFSPLYSYAPQIGLEYWKAFQADDIKKAGQLSKKYAHPFLKNFSHQFWYATMDYFNGTNTYIRKADSPIKAEAKMTDEELRKMEKIYKDQGLVPEPYSSCAITDGPSLPRSRGGQAGGIVKGNVVITGGNDWSSDKTTKHWLNETLIYKDEKWQVGPTLPHKGAYMMFDWDESGLYVAGGTDGGNIYGEVYRMSDHDSWDKLADLPVATSSGAAAILDGKLYVACGNTDDGETNKMYVLDITKKKASWKKCASLPGVGRQFPAFTACNGSLYLFGGLVAKPFEALKDSYRYDPKADKWKKLADLSMPGYCWVANPVDDTHLIVTGMANNDGINNGVWVVDLKDMSFNKISSTPLPVCTGPVVKVGENQWWTIGGEPDSTLRRLNEVYLVRLR